MRYTTESATKAYQKAVQAVRTGGTLGMLNRGQLRRYGLELVNAKANTQGFARFCSDVANAVNCGIPYSQVREVLEGLLADTTQVTDPNEGHAGMCLRCMGQGYIPTYDHVEGGVCFACGGTGEASPTVQPKL